MSVVKANIVKACKDLGIKEGDIVLVHSSLKSMGFVEGGPQTVVEGFREAIGSEGTLVMPTLSQKNFEHAYEEWSMDRPSDVGIITETLRTTEGAYRSDQETHSVSAIGKMAKELTCDHKAFGPRYGVYGLYAFGYGSPWQKMYDIGGTIVFLGAPLKSNTYRHFNEYRFVETLLNNIKDDEKRKEMQSRLRFHYIENGKELIIQGVWPYSHLGCINGNPTDTEDLFDQRGMIKKTKCGEADVKALDIKEMSDFLYNYLLEEYESWFQGREEILNWINDCKKYAEY